MTVWMLPHVLDAGQRWETFERPARGVRWETRHGDSGRAGGQREDEGEGKGEGSEVLASTSVKATKATTDPAGAGTSSDGSWVRTGAVPFDEDDVSETDEINPKEVNTNLTKEEAEMILQMRVRQKAEGKGKGLTEKVGK